MEIFRYCRQTRFIKAMSDIDALMEKYGGLPDVPKSGIVKATPKELSNIDDLISKYSGDIEKDKPEGEFWQGLSDDPSWSGLAKRVGVATLRGAKDVVDTGAHGLQNATTFVADKVLPESLAAPIRKSAEDSQMADKAGRENYDKEYGENLPMQASRVGGQIAASAPLMPAKAFQAIDVAANALPVANAGIKVAAPLANRLLAASGKGALGGAEFGATTASTNDKSLSENVGEGAITGAIAGPLISGAGAAGKGILNSTSSGISATRAALAERAAQLGIDLKASQVSGSPTFKKYDQMSGMLPLSGAQAEKDKQVSQFTRAISKTFGKDTDEINSTVIKDARKIQGQRIETVGANSTIQADSQLGQDLSQIVHDASRTKTDAEMRPLMNHIEDIIEKLRQGNGSMDGEAYTSLTGYRSALSKAQRGRSNIANEANEIRNALDDALTRHVSPQQKTELLDARKKYKAVMTVKDLVEGDPDGHVSPLKLMQKVMKAPGGKAGSGELGELADIGRAFFPVPADSGTPLGTKILDMVAPFTRSPIGASVATAAALKSGVGMMDMGLSALSLPVNRFARKALNSSSMREDIINAAKGQTYGKIDKASNALIPYSALPVESRDNSSKKVSKAK